MRGDRYNAQQVVMAGRSNKVHLHPYDREHVTCGCQFGNEQAPLAKILRAGPFKELEVIG